MTTPTPAPAGEGAKVPPDWAVKAAQEIKAFIESDGWPHTEDLTRIITAHAPTPAPPNFP